MNLQRTFDLSRSVILAQRIMTKWKPVDYVTVFCHPENPFLSPVYNPHGQFKALLQIVSHLWNVLNEGITSPRGPSAAVSTGFIVDCKMSIFTVNSRIREAWKQTIGSFLRLVFSCFPGGQVAKLFQDSSLGNAVNIVVTRLILLMEDQVQDS